MLLGSARAPRGGRRLEFLCGPVRARRFEERVRGPKRTTEFGNSARRRCGETTTWAAGNARKPACFCQVEAAAWSLLCGAARLDIGPRADTHHSSCAARRTSVMRQIAGIAMIVFGSGMLLCQWQSSSAPVVREARWVRTVDGWERADSWRTAVAEEPRLHPLVVAAGQGLVSVLALAAFSKGAGRGVPGAG